MNKIGYHAVYETNYITAINLAANNGFDFVQFDLNVPRYYVENLTKRKIMDIKKALLNTGVHISFHAPGDNISLFTDYPPIQKGIIDHFKHILDIANELCANHLTVHPLKPPSFYRSDTGIDSYQVEYFNYYSEVLEQNISELVKYTEGTLICIENYSLSPITINTLNKLLNNQVKMYLTMDIPKMFRPDFNLDPNQEQFFAEHRADIKEIHLHDMNKLLQSHLCIGKGEIDFKKILPKYINDDTWLTIEVRPISEAINTKRIMKEKKIMER